MNFLDTLSNLAADFPKKIIATALGLLASEVLQLHLILIFMFGVLEFCDCFTRWIALSYTRLKDIDGNVQPTIWDCVKGLPAAHRAAYIQSEIMRKQFYSKMLTYLILIIATGCGDYIIRLTHRPDILLSIVVTYISVTELLSVLENLNDAGVSMAASLLSIVKSKVNIATPEHEKPDGDRKGGDYHAK